MQNKDAVQAAEAGETASSNEAEAHVVKIRSIENVTHDVLCIRTDRVPHYHFSPGQATEISINAPGWKEARRPFTFTSLPGDDHLEFVIKTYPQKKGVTNQLLHVKEGDELILHDVFGTIGYQGEGVFIAGGAGVTPFIAIFRHLQATNAVGKNKLICANKTKADIILKDYFQNLLHNNFINILSDEEAEPYAHGYISADFLSKHITRQDQRFYICGPEPMMDAVEKQLTSLNVDGSQIIKEQF